MLFVVRLLTAFDFAFTDDRLSHGLDGHVHRVSITHNLFRGRLFDLGCQADRLSQVHAAERPRLFEDLFDCLEVAAVEGGMLFGFVEEHELRCLLRVRLDDPHGLAVDLRLFLTGCLVPGDPQLIGRERDDLNPGPHFLVSTETPENSEVRCRSILREVRLAQEDIRRRVVVRDREIAGPHDLVVPHRVKPEEIPLAGVHGFVGRFERGDMGPKNPQNGFLCWIPDDEHFAHRVRRWIVREKQSPAQPQARVRRTDFHDLREAQASQNIIREGFNPLLIRLFQAVVFLAGGGRFRFDVGLGGGGDLRCDLLFGGDILFDFADLCFLIFRSHGANLSLSLSIEWM